MDAAVAPIDESFGAKGTEQTIATSDSVVSVELPRLRFFCVWLLVLALHCVCTAYLLTLSLLYSAMATPELEYYARLLSPHADTLFKPASWLAGVGAIAHGYQLCKTQLFRRMAAVATRARFELFARQGFFGVESPYFELRFLVRELIEMVSQTVQVHSASNLIAKRWINHLYVGVVFVNSFSTPLAKHLTRFSPALERLMCLTVDLSLDLITSVAVPLMIAAPYRSDFNMEAYSFEPKLLYSPTWFINLVMENRQVFVRNHFDMVLKVTPHMSIFGYLGSIQTDSRSHTRRLSVRVELMQKHKMHKHKATFVHLVFIAWGLVLVINCACSVFEYNCIRQGTESPSEDAFHNLDAKSVLVLVFSHCSALVVPTSIRQLSKLTGVEIWNSSILSWTSDAGITAQTHPTMAYICIVGTTLTEIPDGLLHDLPTELLDIEISHTNLSSLPDDLDVRWPFVSTLYIEYAQLSEWPGVLSRMTPSDLSLIGNNLRSLPTLSAGLNGATGGYYTLSLSNNPLRTLPDYTGDVATLKFLSLERTLLKELPGWVETIGRHGYNVFLFGTPFCAAKIEAESGSAYGAGAVLTCANTNSRAMGMYPFDEVVAQWRKER
ncbi:hypothetical protein PybrP1_003096 [[Pythium] brassicae (nom. inval.)]|nr:hypothetical protein PybrP1_003096 [[Pythium] brassicae (nom. inval.)]